MQKSRFLSLCPPCPPQPRHPSRQIAHHRVARDAAHRLMPRVGHAKRLRRRSGGGKGRFGVFGVFAARFDHVHDLQHGPQCTKSCAPYRKWGTFMSRGSPVRRGCAPHAGKRAPMHESCQIDRRTAFRGPTSQRHGPVRKTREIIHTH